MHNKLLGAAVLGTVFSSAALAMAAVAIRWSDLIDYLANGSAMW